MTKVVNIASVRADKKRRDDPSRLGNEALVTPAIGDDRDKKCFSDGCHYFAEYDVLGSAEMHGLACRYHLHDFIHRFFSAEYAGKPKGRLTYCKPGENPDWKGWRRAKWRLEYQRGLDEKRSRIEFAPRVTKRELKEAERAAYESALKGE